MNVQTQRSCVNDTFASAVDGLINDYQVTGSLHKDLFVQILPEERKAVGCAQHGWDRIPPVDAVTMWWAVSAMADAKDFLSRRKALLQ